MSGSGGDRGYDYQADAYAYIASHGLAGQPLGWFDDVEDIPVAISMETSGPGDDLRVETADQITIEVQAKHGLRRSAEFDATIAKIVAGLGNSKSLRGVILTNRHASKIIRDDLKQDIVRYAGGRDDNLSETMTDVLGFIPGTEEAKRDICNRLRVVVVDLDESSDGVAAASVCVGQVLNSTSSAPAAFKFLGKQGHELTKTRGRWTMAQVAASLQRHFGLRLDSKTPVADLAKYQEWVLSSTSQFFSPILRSWFPISKAWNQIRWLKSEETGAIGQQSLARQIARYHEWQRLAERSTERAVDAENFVTVERKSVILGGPGAGKSTLAKRIAHVFTREGAVVLRVRLRRVMSLMNQGHTFENAVIAAATDTSGIIPGRSRYLLKQADILVADGLDECDPDRLIIANRLTDWSHGYEHMKLCVLSRPVGHVPDILPGFRHCELMPLTQEAILERSRDFVRALVRNDEDATRTLVELTPQLLNSSDKVISAAARNPLLLTFLARLIVDGISLQGRRVRLFGEILELLYRATATDRDASAQMNRAVAIRVAEIMGFQLIGDSEKPPNQLVTEIAPEVGEGIEGADRVEDALRFWEHQGLVERLTSGSQEALTFVHPAVGEYAAARHIAAMSPTDRSDLLSAQSRSPKWREPILLAAGQGAVRHIVQCLLAKDDIQDVLSTEAALAAAAIAESGDVDEFTVQQVIERLQARLKSDNPLVAIEAGLAMNSLASTAPQLVGAAAAPLVGDGQAWTHLAAVCVSLACGAEFLDREALLRWLHDFVPVQTFFLGRVPDEGTEIPSEAYELQADGLRHAVRRVLSELSPEEAKPVILRLVNNKSASLNMHNMVVEELERKSLSDIADEVRKRLTFDGSEKSAKWVERIRASSQLATQFVIESILNAVGATATLDGRDATQDCDDRFPLIGQLFAASRFFTVPAGDWDILSRQLNPEVVAEVIRGTIAALDLDRDKLVQESRLLRVRVAKSAVWKLLPKVPAEPVWERARTAELNVDKLVRALEYPSRAIAITAAELLATGLGGDIARDSLRPMLSTGEELTLQLIGAIAGDVWHKDACQILHDRLSENLSPGCEYLFEAMARLASDAELHFVRAQAKKGLFANNPAVAVGAAKALLHLPNDSSEAYITELHRALTHWTSRGSWCDRCACEVHQGSCQKCSIVPPNPRSQIVRLLTKTDELSVEGLLQFAGDVWHDVRDVATKSLAARAATNAEVMRDLLDRISKGSAPSGLLNAILELPMDSLRQLSSSLIALRSSEIPIVRARIISALSGGWLDTATARGIVEHATNDPSAPVRSVAARTLRVLTQEMGNHA